MIRSPILTTALLLVVAAALCSGQMCGPPPTDPMFDPDRLQVNDNLRAACVDFMPSFFTVEDLTEFIQVSIDMTEEIRINGMTKQDQINNLAYVCSNPDLSITSICSRCQAAILNQVYGE